MGSKHLKAIAVRGSGKIEVASPEDFNKIRREAFEKVKNDDSFGWTKKYGSMIASTPYNKIGALAGQ